MDQTVEDVYPVDLTGTGHRPLYPHKQLIGRLLKGRCEICASTDTIEVHHVRTLADLATAAAAQPAWAKIMANKRRKTLIVCACGCRKVGHTRRPASTPR